MPPDNGAILTPGSTEGECPSCPEATTLQCGIEPATQQCSTPVCNPNYGSLPKRTQGRLVLRSSECLYDNPTVPTTATQIWQRGLDGLDRLGPLSSEMVPGKADAPCFTTIDEAIVDTFGKMLIAQEDVDTGKKCIKEVPLEDTDTAYLAGYRTEDVASGVPEVRPIRIIPEDIEGCADNIRIPVMTDVTEEIQPGLNRIRPVWKWLKSLVLNTLNVPDYAGDGDQSPNCLQPAAWINDGDCMTLARLAVDTGVLGQWALCGGCLRFYELPKDGGGDYIENMSLAYVGGDDCWEWHLSGYQDGEQLLFSSSAVFGKTVYTLTNIPEGAQFAHIALVNAATVNAPGSFTDQTIFAYYHLDQSRQTGVCRLFTDKAGDGALNDVVEVPIVAGTVAFAYTRTSSGAITSTVSATVVGFS